MSKPQRRSLIKRYSGHVPSVKAGPPDVFQTKAKNNLSNYPKIPSKSPLFPNSKQVLPDIQSNTCKILLGSLNGLPPQKSSVVRIFISSTFSDMSAERNALMREANPKLKQFCRDHGLDFQLVDMRWGISNDLVNDHMTAKLCFQEIANCQRVSMGPNFVVILGNRYGRSHLPPEISAEIFQKLRKTCVLQGYSTEEILDVWYRKDENALKNVFVLQPISSVFPDFNSNDSEVRDKEMKKWWKNEEELKDFVQMLAEGAHDNMFITEEEKHMFEMSVTELEVHMGILQVNEANSKTLSYYRNFVDADEASDRDNQRFLEPNAKYNKQLIDLATAKLPAKLDKECRKEYHHKWAHLGYKANKHEEGLTFLKEFTEDFVSDVQKLILKHVEDKPKMEDEQNDFRLTNEILHHLHICVDKCKGFCGRTDELGEVKRYLKIKGEKQPLLVYGESGSGKTAFMGMVHKMSRKEWLGENSVTMIRFLGTSPYTGNIHAVLACLVLHICKVYDFELQIKRTQQFSNTVKYFCDLLKLVSQKHSSSKPLLILIDSVDQLSPDDGAHTFTWLPCICPPGVYIIVSFIPQTEESHLLKNAYRKFKNDHFYVSLSELSTETGREIIETFLGLQGRTLQSDQENILLKAFQADPKPLYLRLIMDEAALWKSYTELDECILGETVRLAIIRLFERLEKQYGEVFVRFALGYVTVGKNGLSEVELEDALSLNDEVLNSVYQYHSPPVPDIVRVPAHLVPRMRIALQMYMAERQTDGKVTLFWYHRQFIEAATDRYVVNSKVGNQLHQLHSDLAKVFLCRGVYTKTITLVHRNNLVIQDANRQVTWQPLGETNLRMLRVLPYHLTNAGQLDALKKQTLCNLQFMVCKIQGFKFARELLDDYEVALKKFDDKELSAIRDCIRLVDVYIREDINSLLRQILGQLDDISHEWPYIDLLCKDARRLLENSALPQIVPMFGCLPSSYGEQMKWYCEGPSQLLSISEDKSLALLTTEELDGRIKKQSYQVLNLDTLILYKDFKAGNTTFTQTGSGKFSSVDSCFSYDLSKTYLLFNDGVRGFRVDQSKELEYQNSSINKDFDLNDCIKTCPFMPNTYALGGDRSIVFVEDVPLADGKWTQKSRITLKFPEAEETTNILFDRRTGQVISSHVVSSSETSKHSVIAIWAFAQKRLLRKISVSSVVQRGMMALYSRDEKLTGVCKGGELFDIDLVGDSTEPLIMTMCPARERGTIHFVQFNHQLCLVLYVSNKGYINTSTMSAHALESGKSSVEVTCVALSADGKGFATGHKEGSLSIWRREEDEKTLVILTVLKAHLSRINNICVMDGENILTFSDDKTIRMWEVNSILTTALVVNSDDSVEEITDITRLSSVRYVYITNNEKYLVTASREAPPSVWMASSGKHIVSCEGTQGTLKVMLGKADTLIVGQSFGKILTWTLQTGVLYKGGGLYLNGYVVKNFTIVEQGNTMVALRAESMGDVVEISDFEQVLRKISLNEKIEARIKDMIFNGNFLVISTMNDEGGQLSRSYCAVDLDGVTSLVYYCQIAETGKSRDNASKAVTGYSIGKYTENSFIVGGLGYAPVWTMGSNCIIPKPPGTSWWLQPHKYIFWDKGRKSVQTKVPVTCVVTSQSGKQIVTGSRDGTLVIWEDNRPEDEEVFVRVFPHKHSGRISFLEFFKKMPLLLLSGSMDKTIRLWNVASHLEFVQPIALIHTHMQIRHLMLSKSENHIVAWGKNLDNTKAMVFEVMNIH